jgi:hypothetical protein
LSANSPTLRVHFSGWRAASRPGRLSTPLRIPTGPCHRHPPQRPLKEDEGTPGTPNRVSPDSDLYGFDATTERDQKPSGPAPRQGTCAGPLPSSLLMTPLHNNHPSLLASNIDVKQTPLTNQKPQPYLQSHARLETKRQACSTSLPSTVRQIKYQTRARDRHESQRP